MPDQPPSLDLVGSAEAARLLGIDRSTLSRWVSAGRVQVAHRMPGVAGAVLFDRAEVERVRATVTAGERSA